MTDKIDDGSTGYDDNPGGRPKKYASAAERQAAYRARAVEVSFRADPGTVETLGRIAETIDVPRTDLLLSMTKFALANHDWARFGLTHKTLPKYQGNPIMTTAAQIAARKRFAEMARSGAFAKTRKPAAKKAATRSNPAPAKRKIPTVVYQVQTKKPGKEWVAYMTFSTAALASAEAHAYASMRPTYSVRVHSFSVQS